MKFLLAVLVLLLGNSYAASAADNADPASGADSFDWSGLYVGAYVAYGLANTRSSDGINSEPQDPYLGVLGGYTLALDKIVIGIEGDMSFSDLDGDTGSGAGFVSQDIDNIATVRGRIGMPFDELLVYLSAGWSLADSERNTHIASDSKVLNGPAVGVGFQYALSQHLAGRIEYEHIDYGKVKYDIPGLPKVDSNVDAVKLGLDYLF